MVRTLSPFWRANGYETEFGAKLIGSLEGPPAYTDCVLGSCFFRNGTRRYIDVGMHHEVATGEVVTPEEVMYHVEASYLLARRYLPQRGAQRVVQRLYANNTSLSTQLSTYGVYTWSRHRNYQIPRDTDLYPLYDFLTSFMVSGILVFGSGYMLHGGGFLLSPRAHHITALYGGQTTCDRPLHNTRDEPHSTTSRRLHSTSLGNAQILPFMTAVDAAAMLGVLAVFETRRGEPPVLFDALKSMNALNADPGRLLSTDRGPMSAVDIQRWYFDRVYELVVEAGDEAVHLLPGVIRWGNILDGFARSLDPMDHRGVTDWTTKLAYQRVWMDRHPRPNDTDERRAWQTGLDSIEASMHEVTSETDSPSLRDRFIAKWSPLDADKLRAATEYGSPHTRARVRGWVQWFMETAYGKHEGLDWSAVTLRRPNTVGKYESFTGRVTLQDPLDPNPPDKLLEIVAATRPNFPLLEIL